MKSLERQLQTSLAIILVLILLGLVVIANLSTRSLLTEFVTSRLELDAVRLLDTLVIKQNEIRIHWGRLNPVYATPNSGHYFAIKQNNGPGTIYSPSLQKSKLLMPEAAELLHNKATVVHDAIGPEGQHLIIWTKAFNKAGQGVVIAIAEDMSQLKSNRQNFSLLFITIGILGFLLMLAIQHFVVHRLFKHLDKSRQEIKQIESGDLQQLSEDVPTEIYPLVKEFNHSISLMQQRMTRSRNSLGNLAHALKTPISLLMQQLDNNENPAHAKQQAERIRQLTERELKRARLAGLGNTTQRFNPREELPTLIDVLKQAHNKKHLEVSLKIATDIHVFCDREDMLELLGNLMDNAFKWANTRVTCTIFLDKKESIVIFIEDDGKGQESKALEQIEQRGVRLDESVEGYGLGLAICKDIVRLYAGSITFGRSENLGGFLVDVKLPISG